MPDPTPLASGLSGRDFYADKYASELDREAEWLRRTAGQKADSIAALLDGSPPPYSVLEIGAGTGAVIGELRRRGIGTEHFAVDFSGAAVAELRRREPGVRATTADITATPDPFGEEAYDLAFATHVVEHLEEPEAFLRALLDVPARRVIVEVPLEDLPLGRLKALVGDRSTNAAGHVQFFDRRSFRRLLERSGWRVVRAHTYAPRLDAEAFELSHGRAGRARRAAKRLTEQVLPRLLGRAWTALYHAHHAALCVPARSRAREA